MKTKVVNGFVWLIVTDVAKEIYVSDIFDLFILHDDDSESLIKDFSEINQALEDGQQIGIEVGHLTIK